MRLSARQSGARSRGIVAIRERVLSDTIGVTMAAGKGLRSATDAQSLTCTAMVFVEFI